MFFSTRTIAPGNLTFHTARLSVSPRKPFPDENQSEEPSKLPDNPCGQDQGQVESCAANVGRSDAASFTQRAEASSAEPSYLLSSTQQKVLHGRKHHRSHFLTQQLLRLPARAHTLFGSLCSSGSGPADLARQQVGDWKDERAININSPPRPPFCVLKYLIILGRLRCSVGRARADPFYKTTPVPAQ